MAGQGPDADHRLHEGTVTAVTMTEPTKVLADLGGHDEDDHPQDAVGAVETMVGMLP